MGILQNRQLNGAGVTGEYYAGDFGLIADGQQDDTPAISAMLNAAQDAGGGVCRLPAGGVTVAVGSTVKLPSNVELVIPAGTTLKLLAGKNVDLIQNADQSGGNSNVRISGGGTLDGNRANQTSAGRAINWQNVTDGEIVGVRVTGAYLDGILLNTCTRVSVVDAEVTSCGSHGIALSGATYCTIAGCHAYDNCKVATAGTADGVNLAGASTDNLIVGLVAYDTAGAGGRQRYGVREAPASSCNRNYVVGGSFNANQTGEVSLIGAASQQIGGSGSFGTPGSSAVGDSVNAGTATTVARSDHRHGREAFGAATGTAGNSASNGAATTLARSDHGHAIASGITPVLGSLDPPTAIGQATLGSIAKGWAYFTVSGGTPSLVLDYNVAGLVDDGVGAFTVQWDLDMTASSYAFLVTARGGVAESRPLAVGSAGILINDYAGAAVDPTAVSCVVFST